VKIQVSTSVVAQGNNRVYYYQQSVPNGTQAKFNGTVKVDG